MARKYVFPAVALLLVVLTGATIRDALDLEVYNPGYGMSAVFVNGTTHVLAQDFVNMKSDLRYFEIDPEGKLVENRIVYEGEDDSISPKLTVYDGSPYSAWLIVEPGESQGKIQFSGLKSRGLDPVLLDGDNCRRLHMEAAANIVLVYHREKDIYAISGKPSDILAKKTSPVLLYSSEGEITALDFAAHGSSISVFWSERSAGSELNQTRIMMLNRNLSNPDDLSQPEELLNSAREINSMKCDASSERFCLSYAEYISGDEEFSSIQLWALESSLFGNFSSPVKIGSGKSASIPRFVNYDGNQAWIVWSDNEVYRRMLDEGERGEDLSRRNFEIYSCSIVNESSSVPVMLTSADSERSIGVVLVTNNDRTIIWMDLADGYNLYMSPWHGAAIGKSTDLTGNETPGIGSMMAMLMIPLIIGMVAVFVWKFRAQKKAQVKGPEELRKTVELEFVKFVDLRSYVFLKWFFLIAGGTFMILFMVLGIMSDEYLEPGFRIFPLGIFLNLMALIMGASVLYKLSDEKDVSQYHRIGIYLTLGALVLAAVGVGAFGAVQYLGWKPIGAATFSIHVSSILSFSLAMAGPSVIIAGATGRKGPLLAAVAYVMVPINLIYGLWQYSENSFFPYIRCPAYYLSSTNLMPIMVITMMVSIFFTMMLIKSLGREKVKKLKDWTADDLSILRRNALIFVGLMTVMFLGLEIFMFWDLGFQFEIDTTMLVFGALFVVMTLMLHKMMTIRMTPEQAKKAMADSPSNFIFGGYAMPLITLIMSFVCGMLFGIIGGLIFVGFFFYQEYSFDRFLRQKGFEYIKQAPKVIEDIKKEDKADRIIIDKGRRFTRVQVAKYINRNERMILTLHGILYIVTALMASGGLKHPAADGIGGIIRLVLVSAGLLIQTGLVIYLLVNFRRIGQARSLTELIQYNGKTGMEVMGYVVIFFLTLLGMDKIGFISISSLVILGGVITLMSIYKVKKKNVSLPNGAYLVKGPHALGLKRYVDSREAAKKAREKGIVSLIGDEVIPVHSSRDSGKTRLDGSDSSSETPPADTEKPRKIGEGEHGAVLCQEPSDMFEKRKKQSLYVAIFIMAMPFIFGGILGFQLSIMVESINKTVLCIAPSLILVPIFLGLGVTMVKRREKLKPITFHDYGISLSNLLGKEMFIPYGFIEKFNISAGPKGRIFQGVQKGYPLNILVWPELEALIPSLEKRFGNPDYIPTAKKAPVSHRGKETFVYICSLPLGFLFSALIAVQGDMDNFWPNALGMMPLGVSISLVLSTRVAGLILKNRQYKPDPRPFFAVLVVGLVLGIPAWFIIPPGNFIMSNNDEHQMEMDDFLSSMTSTGLINDTELLLEDSLVVDDELSMVNVTLELQCTVGGQYAVYVGENARLTLINCTVKGRSRDLGAAFEVHGELEATDTTFYWIFGTTDQTNGQGGIEFYSSYGNFQSCTFRDMLTNAVMEFDSEIFFNDCVFENVVTNA